MAPKHFGDLSGRIDPWHEAIGQVGPVGDSDKHGGFAQPELLDDVLADAGRGCRSERVDAGGWEAVLQRCELAIVRAEVVPPMADAMGLVDREGTNVQLVQESQERLAHQPLGRHQKKPVCAPAQAG